MRNHYPLLLRNLAALFFGMLMTFAFAPYGIFPLAIVAIVGLLVLFLNASPKQALALGFSFGVGLFGLGVYWVFNSIHDIGDVPTLLAIFITAGMVAILASYPALVGYVTNRYFPFNNATKILCAFPAIWLVSEIMRGILLTGFPWLFIGYSQTNSPLKGFAPFLSVYGVSLAALLTSALIVNAALYYKQKNLKIVYYNLAALVLIWVVGGMLSYIPWTRPQGQSITVGLVQGNIPQLLKWSPEHLQLSLNRYEQLTEPLWGKDKLIIWPEAAVPLPMQDAADFIKSIDTRAKQTGSELILGIPIQTKDQSGYYNAVISVGNDHQVYLKRRLVPFGEYTPFSTYFERAFNFMNIPMSDDVAGDLEQPPFIIGNTKLHLSICYEVAFPQLMKTHDKTIGLLLTVTNDAWFGHSNAQAQHLQMAAMRAIELGRPELFVSNDGITAVIDQYGKIVAEALPHTTTVLNSHVQPMYGLTPWMRNGMDPITFILLCMFYAAVRQKKQQAKSQLTNSKLATETKLN